MLCWLVLASFADVNVLDFSDPSQLTLRINRTWVCRAIYGIGLIVIRMHEGYKGRIWGCRDS